jgi:hypothetical protein
MTFLNFLLLAVVDENDYKTATAQGMIVNPPLASSVNTTRTNLPPPPPPFHTHTPINPHTSVNRPQRTQGRTTFARMRERSRLPSSSHLTPSTLSNAPSRRRSSMPCALERWTLRRAQTTTLRCSTRAQAAAIPTLAQSTKGTNRLLTRASTFTTLKRSRRGRCVFVMLCLFLFLVSFFCLVVCLFAERV